MAHLIAVNLTQVMEIDQTHFSGIWSCVLQFLYAHQEALIAPLLWILMATIGLCWLPNLTSTPPEPDPKEKIDPPPVSCSQAALSQDHMTSECHSRRQHFLPQTSLEVPHQSAIHGTLHSEKCTNFG
jgi:hypothetical protein